MMKKRFILITILALIVIVGGVGIGLAWRTNRLDKWLPPNIKEMFGRGEKPEEEPGEEPEEPEPAKASELRSLDEIWNLYTNYQLGFSIKVPKKSWHIHGSCKWSTYSDSYLPKKAPVPVRIFEDLGNSTVYIAGEYYYELTGETEEEDYSECNKVLNSLERVKEEYSSQERGYYQQVWEIVVRDIANDVELNEYIKERYGSACEFGRKIPTKQKGVYEVEIWTKEGGVAILGTKCGVYFWEPSKLDCYSQFKYYPAKDKLIAWDTGQSSRFDKPSGVYYHKEMHESIRFIE